MTNKHLIVFWIIFNAAVTYLSFRDNRVVFLHLVVMHFFIILRSLPKVNLDYTRLRAR